MTKPKDKPAPRGIHPNSRANLLPGGNHRKGNSTPLTKLVKEVIHMAFDAMPAKDSDGSGLQAFKEWAAANPTIFYTQIWVKVLPLEVKADINVTNNIAERLARAYQIIEGEEDTLQ